MSKIDNSLPVQKIDRKWVREEKRTFSVYPGLPRNDIFGEENWLEMLQFYHDDVKWLLSLEHHKFWSHVIYSENVHELLISFFKESPPIFLKNNYLFEEDIKNLISEIEHLVFLVFLRLSTEKESESCYIKQFGDVIYNNYLFTVPVILDICLIYGTSNPELVKEMINNIITAAPDFLDDFQEIIPQFIHVLKIVEEKLLVKHEVNVEEKSDQKSNELLDLVLYFYDAVATIQKFFELYSNVCQLFSRGELVNEIVYFYSNVLPKMFIYWTKRQSNESSLMCNLIENARIDLLKITKSIFDFIFNEIIEVAEKNEEIVNDYLDLLMKLLSEPSFFSDYNSIYSVEFELECAIKNCQNVDLGKVNNILKETAQRGNEDESGIKDSVAFDYPDDTGVKLNSLVTEVKDIFPHLEETFIRQCLSYYNNSSEKVIAAVLENLVPSDLNQNVKPKKMLEFRGKHKNKHENFNKMLDEKEEINKIKERYMQLSFVIDEIYDDEYDDTYDENIDVSVRDGDETVRRPFVVPRILRAGKENDDDDDDDDCGDNDEDGVDVNDDDDDDDDDDNDNDDNDDDNDYHRKDEKEENPARQSIIQDDKKVKKKRKEEFSQEFIVKDCFIENPAILRESVERRRLGRRTRDVAGNVKGLGQSKQVLKNREFKESHKSFIANHNRKKLAAKKMT